MPIPPNLLVTAWLLLASPVATCGTPNGDLELALDGRLDRAKLIGAILERNPRLQAAGAAWAAARQRPQQARTLEDPMVSYGFSPRSISGDGVSYGQVVRVSQRLPYPGTLRLRGDVAELEAQVAAHDLEALRLSLATLGSQLYDELYVAVRAAEINEEHVALLESFQRIATARYAAGEAPQQAPLQAELELARLLHRRVVLATQRVELTSRINALLHREPAAELPPAPASILDQRLETVEDPTSRASLVDEALENRPELRAAGALLAARRAEAELARLASKPGFELTGSFSSLWTEPAYRTSVGVGINLPIHRPRLRAARAEAEARSAEQASRIDAIADEIRAEVTIRTAQLAEAEHVVELYRSRLIPAADDQVDAALAGFRTGQSTFLALIEAERSQRDVRLGYEHAIADLSRLRRELDRAVGRMPVSAPVASGAESPGGVASDHSGMGNARGDRRCAREGDELGKGATSRGSRSERRRRRSTRSEEPGARDSGG